VPILRIATGFRNNSPARSVQGVAANLIAPAPLVGRRLADRSGPDLTVEPPL